MLKFGGPLLGDWSTFGSSRSKDGPRIITSPFPDIQIPKISLPELAFRYMEEFADKTFMIEDATGEEFSYSRALSETRCLSGALLHLGIQPGDVVCLFSTNRAQYIVTFLAMAALGAAVTHANPLGTEGELKIQVEQTKVVCIVADDSNYKLAKQVADSLNHVKGVIVLGAEEAEGCVTYSQLMAAGNEPLNAPIPKDPTRTTLHIPFSSGTTGLPKGVIITHHNAVASVYQMSTEWFSVVDSEDVTLLVLPLFHLYAVLMVTYVMASGSKIVLQRCFKPASFLEAIQKYKVSFIPLVPPLALFLLESPLTYNYDTSSLKVVFSAAASLAPAIAQKLKTKFKLRRLMQGYGMTETGFTVVTPRFNQHLDSVGVALQNTEIKVVDSETGSILTPFQKGEICVRTPQMSPGYLNNDLATTELIDKDGWAHTGDVGYYDDAGRIYFLERVKEIFKNKGHQVAPAELESLLLTHPSVVDAAVIGTPDSRAGDLPRAFLVLRNDSDCTAKDIQDFVAGLSSPEKHLRGGVFFLQNIPKSVTGKIDRKTLRNLTC